MISERSVFSDKYIFAQNCAPNWNPAEVAVYNEWNLLPFFLFSQFLISTHPAKFLNKSLRQVTYIHTVHFQSGSQTIHCKRRLLRDSNSAHNFAQIYIYPKKQSVRKSLMAFIYLSSFVAIVAIGKRMRKFGRYKTIFKLYSIQFQKI